jgi:hypothetical protein
VEPHRNGQGNANRLGSRFFHLTGFRADVQSFYKQLKESLRDSLEAHLRSQFERFTRILLNRANSVYPNVKQELRLIIEDRLHAIESGLAEMNDQQKATLLETLKRTINFCNKIRTKIAPLRLFESAEQAIVV